jgi:Family of unknown function (DUF5367)
MKTQDRVFLLLFGLVFWALGTLWYRARGAVILETTTLLYWINFIATPVLSALVCILLLKLRRVPAPGWASAALLIALPGMFGEALILSRFAAFMPRMHEASAGRYGAFLFAAYALFLTVAEVVTLRAQ